MFSIDQINNAAKKVKSGADFPQLVHDLKVMGVTHYETRVTNGQTVYYGKNNVVVSGEPKYSVIEINPDSSASTLREAIYRHQKGQTDYPTFCNQAAEAGVERWVTHINEMTVTYIDRHNNKLIIEPIPYS